MRGVLPVLVQRPLTRLGLVVPLERLRQGHVGVRVRHNAAFQLLDEVGGTSVSSVATGDRPRERVRTVKSEDGSLAGRVECGYYAAEAMIISVAFDRPQQSCRSRRPCREDRRRRRRATT